MHVCTVRSEFSQKPGSNYNENFIKYSKQTTEESSKNMIKQALPAIWPFFAFHTTVG
jgi:hypothetical protein